MRALLPLVLLAACGDVTEVVVRVDASGIAVPSQLDRVRILVTDPVVDGDGGARPGPTEYESPTVQLCDPSTPVQPCESLPISLTLVPGSHDPSAQVRVEVQGFAPGATAPTTDDASVFSFVHGARADLHFTLRSACLGVDCASADSACTDVGSCEVIGPTMSTSDLALSQVIARVQETSGTVAISSTTTPGFVVQIPQLASGDLIIAFVDFSGSWSDSLTESPWMRLAYDASSSESHVVAYRFASGTAADQNLVLGNSASGGQLDYFLVAYRNAGTPDLRFAQVDTNHPSGQTLAAQPLPAGGAYLGVIGATPECMPNDPSGQVESNWVVFTDTPTSPVPAHVEAEHGTTCSASADPYETSLVIPPLPSSP